MLEAANPKHVASFQGHQTSTGAPRAPCSQEGPLWLRATSGAATPPYVSKFQLGKTPLVFLKGGVGGHEADHKENIISCIKKGACVLLKTFPSLLIPVLT